MDTKSVILILIFTLGLISTSESRWSTTSCYVCRSNEHCGDPFRNSPTNEDRISLLDPVTVSYCPSGWCSKQIEGIRGKFEDDDEPDPVTDRFCLGKAPPHDKEGCVEMEISRKIWLLCHCKGNLCNKATFSSEINLRVVLFSLFSSYVIMRHFLTFV
ncbi:uncharacterized protein LOC110857316 [Folsomia candida]|nr:uncharacterized protein LOC110857316 [Folsomia candida]